MSDPLVCTITVTSDGRLPSTGAEGALLLPLLLAAAVLLIVGLVAMTGRRTFRRGSTATVGVVTLLILGMAATQPAPVSAAPGGVAGQKRCELISVADITRSTSGHPTNLLPGQQNEVLSMTVRNRAAFPIDLTLTTSSRASSQGLPAEHFVLLVESAGDTLAAGSLSEGPTPATRTLQPGARLPVTVSAALSAEATNVVQGERASFDLILTATGP